MRRRTGMAAVELVEPDDAIARPADQAPARRSRRWLLVPVLVVVVALVVVQVVVELRERAAVAALAQVDGVVRPVGEDVRVLWTLDPGTTFAPWSGTTDGVLVGLERAGDGSQALVAVDELHRGAPLDHPARRGARRGADGRGGRPRRRLRRRAGGRRARRVPRHGRVPGVPRHGERARPVGS